MEAKAKKLSNMDVPDLILKLKAMKLSEHADIKIHLDDLYHNTGDSYIDDHKYDIIKKILLDRDPSFDTDIGSKVRENNNRVRLPYWLGSADKMTPETPGKIERWMKSATPTVTISDKLDGVSCLLVHKQGETRLYTRGDGVIGGDITFLTKYIKNIPSLKGQKDIAIRGELLISKKNFAEKYKGKGYKNERNMVSGVIGSNSFNKAIKDIDFVVYEIVSHDQRESLVESKPITSQYKLLKKLKFKVVHNDVVPKNIDLIKTLKDRRAKSEYPIDGIIIHTNKKYIRNIKGNPKYLFAFKMLFIEDIRETRVTGIEWNVSKFGMLKPTVLVEPVNIGGVTIKRVTGHNAGYIKASGIGVGAVLAITRSMEVIPYIVKVVSAVKPGMPNIPYEWDKTKVNIITNKCQKGICIKLLTSFFKNLKIKYLGKKTIEKFYTSGHNNLLKILNLSVEDITAIDTFKEKAATRIVDNLHAGMNNLDVGSVIGYSAVLSFGIGKTRVDALLEVYPDIFVSYRCISKKKLISNISEIKGFSNITATRIADHIRFADLLLKRMNEIEYVSFKSKAKTKAKRKRETKFEKKKKARKKQLSDIFGSESDFTENYEDSDSEEFKELPLAGKTYYLTGGKDDLLTQAVLKAGGSFAPSFKKSITALLVSNPDKAGKSKITKAEKWGLPIIQKEDFLANL
jgi:NAD-dependent DNA ligase